MRGAVHAKRGFGCMPATTKRDVSLKDVLKVSDTIAEYSYLETVPTVRQAQRQLFVSDKIWSPQYVYPKLQQFVRNGEAAGDLSYDDLKACALGSIRTLHAAEESGQIDANVAQLYVDFYQARMSRLLLLKTAQELAEPVTRSVRTALQHRFQRLNESLYGRFDDQRWLSMMASERERLMTTPLRGITAGRVKQKLYAYFDALPVAKPERPLFDDDLRATYYGMIHERYAPILQVIPTTGDRVHYDAEQCAAIMRHTLAVGGFRDWRVIVDPAKTSPSTDVDQKIIALPSSTRRTANELKRLIMHEQEVHARRGQNGARQRQLPVLYYGTANYAAVEEGLGLFLEIMLSGSADSPAVHRARDRYIATGLALGGSGHGARDARETYEVLWRIIAVRLATEGVITDEVAHRAKQHAYGHMENAFRGTDFRSRGVIYAKLKVYYEGLLQNVAYMQSIAGNEARFDEIFIGKYDHTNARERQTITACLNGELRSMPESKAKQLLRAVYLH